MKKTSGNLGTGLDWEKGKRLGALGYRGQWTNDASTRLADGEAKKSADHHLGSPPTTTHRGRKTRPGFQRGGGRMRGAFFTGRGESEAPPTALGREPSRQSSRRLSGELWRLLEFIGRGTGLTRSGPVKPQAAGWLGLFEHQHQPAPALPRPHVQTKTSSSTLSTTGGTKARYVGLSVLGVGWPGTRGRRGVHAVAASRLSLPPGLLQSVEKTRNGFVP